MFKAVADTNIYVSALFYGGNPERIIELARKESLLLFTSPPIIRELKRVLADKFGWQLKEIEVAINELLKFVQVVNPFFSVRIITSDPDDNKILECAVQARAHFIITGDRHLLRLKNFLGAEILAPEDFLKYVK